MGRRKKNIDVVIPTVSEPVASTHPITAVISPNIYQLDDSNKYILATGDDPVESDYCTVIDSPTVLDNCTIVDDTNKYIPDIVDVPSNYEIYEIPETSGSTPITPYKEFGTTSTVHSGIVMGYLEPIDKLPTVDKVVALVADVDNISQDVEAVSAYIATQEDLEKPCVPSVTTSSNDLNILLKDFFKKTNTTTKKTKHKDTDVVSVVCLVTKVIMHGIPYSLVKDTTISMPFGVAKEFAKNGKVKLHG